jgi:hypothetical protein
MTAFERSIMGANSIRTLVTLFLASCCAAAVDMHRSGQVDLLNDSLEKIIQQPFPACSRNLPTRMTVPQHAPDDASCPVCKDGAISNGILQRTLAKASDSKQLYPFGPVKGANAARSTPLSTSCFGRHEAYPVATAARQQCRRNVSLAPSSVQFQRDAVSREIIANVMENAPTLTSGLVWPLVSFPSLDSLVLVRQTEAIAAMLPEM